MFGELQKLLISTLFSTESPNIIRKNELLNRVFVTNVYNVFVSALLQSKTVVCGTCTCTPGLVLIHPRTLALALTKAGMESTEAYHYFMKLSMDIIFTKSWRTAQEATHGQVPSMS